MFVPSVCFASTIAQALTKAGLHVSSNLDLLTVGSSVDDSVKDAARFITVCAPTPLLAREAERFGYYKARRSFDGRLSEDGNVQDGKLSEFQVTLCPNVFGDCNAPGFWTESEQADLIREVIELVHFPVDELGKLLPGEDDDVWLANSSLIDQGDRSVPFKTLWNPHISIVETVCPLHGDGSRSAQAKVWSKGSLLQLTPINALNEYFGPHNTLYFAWMRTFTIWLW